jgi:hypothetical protein
MGHSSVITNEQVSATLLDVTSLGFDAKVKRLESIGQQQPAVTGAVVQLARLGVDNAIVDHAFHVLLVVHECFVRDVPNLQEISVSMVEDAMRSNIAMLEQLDRETPDEASRLQRAAAMSYPEQNVLAFVTGYLHEQGILEFSREHELVVSVCKAIIDSYVEAKRLTSQSQA